MRSGVWDRGAGTDSHLLTRHSSNLIVKRLGLVDYEPTWRAMQRYTADRGDGSNDELWLLEHPPVYTLGLAGRLEHILDPGDIPVIHVDRGGQVTYHGPGQLVVYLLLDLKRRRLSVRELVRLMEDEIIALLRTYGVTANRRPDAPGVYIEGAKIASLGLRIRRGCCYHGLALNVDNDLSPFTRIDPCGYPGLAVTRTRDLGIAEGTESIGDKLARELTGRF